MSIKTSKRIALGVIASLVFAPFAAIAPASAANVPMRIVDATPDVADGEYTLGDVVTITIDGEADGDGIADDDTISFLVSVTAPATSAIAMDDNDGDGGGDIYADGFGGDFDASNVTASGTRVTLTNDGGSAAFAELDLGDLVFTPDVVGTYTFVIRSTDAAGAATGEDVTVTITVLAADTTFGLDEGDFYIATAANTEITATGTGVCLITDNDEDVTSFAEVVYMPATSTAFGLDLPALNVTETRNLRVTVTGGTINLAPRAEAGGASALTLTSGNTVATFSTTANANDDITTTFIPVQATGVGSVTIAVADVLKSTGVATAVASYTITYVATCTAGVYSADDSFARLQTSSTALTAMPDPAIDVVGANKVTATGTGYLAMYLRDVYDEAISDTNSALVATATAGAVIAWNSATPTQSTVVLTSSLSTAVLYIKAGTAGTNPVTVEVKLNGTTVASKTLSFTGAASTIAISAKKTSIAAGATTANAFKYAISDTAGTRIASSASVTKVDGVYVTSATASAGSATAASGVEVTCSSLLGKGSVTLTYATTKTEVVDVVCAGGIASFEVTTSKSAYDRAEIGVLTISAKDLAGQPVADGTDLATAAGKIQFTGSGATLAKTVAATDEFMDGKIDYAFTTSTTAGSYNFALWHGDLSPAVTKIAAFTVNAAAVAPSYTKPTLTSSVEGGRVLLFGACEADEGDMVVYVKRPGGAWNEKAKTLECVAGEFDGSIKAPKSSRLFRVKQEGTGLWSGSVLARP